MKKRKQIVLNEGQQEAVKLIQEFLKSDKTEFCLSGVGGTGKSTVMFEVFKRKKPNKNDFYVPKSVIGITVTHQARLNLMQHLPNCTTFAAAANLMMEIDPNGQIYFTPKSEHYKFSELMAYKTIVVDECSMFDDAMIETLKKCMAKNSKVIYLGDFHQLPPISSDGDKDSPTFSIPDSYELKEKMRTEKDNAISDLCDLVCYKIENNSDLSFIKELKNNFNTHTKKGYAITNFHNVINSFVANFKNGLDVRITSYRNRRIEQINDTVRACLWDDMAFNKYVIGEMIVLTDQYNPWGSLEAYNGQVFIVNDIKEDTIEYVHCYMLIVNRGTKKKPDWLSLPVPSDKGRSTYNKRLAELRKLGQQTREWKEYMDFKNQFAQVAYGYAVSNYKIQGATLHGCYVDLSDILDVKMISDKRKLQAFYVGISRPTNFLAIF